MAKKLAVTGIPGLFNAPVAIETYAKVFEEEGALDKLEAFASLNGPRHYRLPPNEARITLEKTSWTAPAEIKVEGPDEKTLSACHRTPKRGMQEPRRAEEIKS
jgi:dihydroorotase